jgi:ubiquinone/menaquinone biosynthesis C-methylase UbiE
MSEKSESGFQLEGSAPEAYEAYLVPTLFAPCAQRLLEAVGLRAGARVVDVACGTGIVGRRAAPLVGPSGTVTGVDVNPAMVEVAARLGPGVDWTVGDAASLPIDGGAMDVWCCQQGLQFVPDRPAVLAEARRVLVPGGRVAVAVWRGVPDNPAFAAFADALAEVVDEEAAAMMRAPFAFGDRDEVRDLLSQSGFTDVILTLQAFAPRFPSARDLLHQEVAASPLADAVGGLSPEVKEQLATELERRLDHLTDDAGVVAPMQTWLAVATR